MSDHFDDAEGLAYDLPALVGRRRALTVLGGASLAALAACGPPPTGGPPPGDGGASKSVGAGEIPEETNGPYPADGSNGVNALTESGVVRSDIRSSFGDASGTAEGTPLAVTLTLVDVSSDSDPGSVVADAAIYVWHCSREGDYSLYSDGFEDENWLRGVQKTDAKGQVTFTTIFPGCYSGRWPHIHFEVYPSLAEATSAGAPRATSQVALPEDVCDIVYATDGYGQSVQNLSHTSVKTDNVFGDDGGVHQLATVTGNVTDGYVAVLDLAV
jgi:protocatechuate 3,4-dioxygenase beta subunit